MIHLDTKEGQRDAHIRMEEGEAGYIRRKTFTDCHLVLSDNLDQTEDDIADFDELPQINDEKNGTHVVGRQFKEIATVIHPETGVKCILWEVEVSYDSKYPGLDGEGGGSGGSGGSEPDPTDLRPKRRRYVEHEKEPFTFDAETGAAVATQANEQILLEKDMAVVVMEITRYENFPFDGQIYLDYINTVNETEFYGAPKGTCWMADIEDEEVVVDGRDYAKVVYRIKGKFIKYGFDDEELGIAAGALLEDSWTQRPLHQGYHYREGVEGAGTDIIAISLSKDNKHPMKVNLRTADDADRYTNTNWDGGTILADDEPPNYLVFHEFPHVDWGPLNLEF